MYEKSHKLKSWTSLNFTFKLDTLYLSSIFVSKIYVRVHTRKDYATMDIHPKS